MNNSINDTGFKVAVIGSGLAGLTAVHIIESTDYTKEDGSKVKFSAHLFEKSKSIGMDSSSITIETTQSSFRLDTPMRAINSGTHNRVYKLYKYLGVALRPASFSYSFSRLSSTEITIVKARSAPLPYSIQEKKEDGEIQLIRPISTTKFLYAGQNGLTWPPLSLPSQIKSGFATTLYCLDVAILTISYIYLLALAFFYYGTGLTRRGSQSYYGIRNVSTETMASFCSRHWIGKRIRDEVLEPLYAAVSTVGREEVDALPVAELLDYICGTFGNEHWVTVNGVQELVRLLIAPIPSSQIHLGTTVSLSSASPDSVKTRVNFDDTYIDFDVVIFATQANQAASLLKVFQESLLEKDALEIQKRIEALEKFEYISTLVVNHYDSTILPLPADQRDLNLASFASMVNSKKIDPTSNTLPTSSIQATHIISNTHPSLTSTLPAGVQLLQTTNPMVEISPNLILSSTWYERAILAENSKKILPLFLLPDPTEEREWTLDEAVREKKDSVEKLNGKLQGFRNIYFIGSWCADGIPLLEGTVVSAERCVATIVKKEKCWAQGKF